MEVLIVLLSVLALILILLQEDLMDSLIFGRYLKDLRRLENSTVLRIKRRKKK